MQGDSARIGYLPYVDGLRAIAVLAVIAYHLDPAWLPGGFGGVDVFFVISGFVVSASIARSEGQGLVAAWSGFYARRLRRIVPPLLACLLATSVASALFIPDAWLSDTSQRTGLMAFVGLSNWVLASTGSDYFSPKAEFNPYTHTWSLGVEEQFYLLFPLLFLPWLRGGRPRGLSAGLFAVVAVASLAYAWHVARSGGAAAAFYVTPARLWQLAAGVLLFQSMAMSGGFAAATAHDSVLRARLRGAGIAAALGLLGAGFVLARPGESPWPDGLWSVAGTLGLLGLVFRGQDGLVGRTLSSAPLVAIGRLSYSLYLWHWPVFVLFRWTVGLDSLPLRAAALAVAIVLAVASYRWVERPARHAPALVRMRPVYLVAAAAVVVVACGFGHGLVARHAPAYSLSVVTRHADDWYPGRGVPEAGAEGCRIEQATRSIGATGAWTFRRTGCADAATRAGHVFVAGDSHASVYSGLLQRLVLDTGLEVTLYAVGGCPLVAMQPAREREPGCHAYGTDVLGDVLASARAGDVLFLPSLRLPRLSEQWMQFDASAALRSVHGPRARKARAEAAALALERLRPLAERGIRIVFEAPTPLFRAPAYRCSDWFNRGNPVCAGGLTVDRAFLEDMRAPVVDTLVRIASDLPAATVWDPFPILCPGRTCHANGTRPLFFDGDHLSGHANRVLLPGFTAHIAALPTGLPAGEHAGP